ncbi:K(+)-transporting ATPase subunit C [uncultured Bacteroides sp.]|uniref:K(+)-transporting ATPase subunit C n=1 Tax=uncultured Bacteroides sp. TaxID=162156 RepID=UPI002AAC2AE7|nr:K(+)-transporting ATPase subunit C [uncultured Bacteroides sp.]
MKTTLIKSAKITLMFCLLLGVSYVFVLWIFAQVASPNKGNAEMITLNGKVVGAANVGQEFTKDIYFWGRPSAVNYAADASGGSNKSVTNKKYLENVESKIKTFLAHHPYLKRSEVPIEMVTASGSGLDPDITPQCAYVQIKRIALARGISESAIKEIVEKQIQKPFLGIFGTAKVNVLKLNVALEEARK